MYSEARLRSSRKYEEKRKEYMTTVRISKELRDKWKMSAAKSGFTMAHFLELLIDKTE